MATRKVTISVPVALAEQLKEEVELGRAPSVSALVCEAVERRLRSERLDEVLTDLRQEIGPPSRRDREWVRRVLGR